MHVHMCAHLNALDWLCIYVCTVCTYVCTVECSLHLPLVFSPATHCNTLHTATTYCNTHAYMYDPHLSHSLCTLPPLPPL